MAIVTMTKREAELKLADAGIPKDISGGYFILEVLQALGLIHFQPDLSPVQKALCAIMTETEVRQGEDYGKLTCGYISEYGSDCIIDGLKQKGYKIVKNSS